jgi:hypothetical protein
LTVAGINLTSIGVRCFFNAYASSGGTALILGKVMPSIGTDAFRGTSLTVTISPMNASQLLQYAY